jgi:hypothetical protein
MIIEDLTRQPQFDLLTEKEQTFLIRYLETEGDWYEAVKYAYICKDAKQTGRTSKRLRNRPFVMGLVRLIDGVHKPTKDELIGEGWGAVLACPSGPAKATLLHFVAKLSGYLDDKGDKSNQSVEDFLKDLDNGKIHTETV